MKGKVAQSQPNVRQSSSAVKGSSSKTKKDVPTAWRDRISPEDY